MATAALLGRPRVIHLLLDSFYKGSSSIPANGVFHWDLVVGGGTAAGVIGLTTPPENILEAAIDPFGLPIPPEVPYGAPRASAGPEDFSLSHNNIRLDPLPPALDGAQYPAVGPWSAAIPPPYNPWVANPYTQIPFHSAFTVQLEEAGLQAFAGAGGAGGIRHQFEFAARSDTDKGSNPSSLVAVPTVGVFSFATPLRALHGITLAFRTPDAPFRFAPDVIEASVEADSSIAPGPFVRVRAAGHGLLVGDRVLLAGARTGNPGLDAYLNRPEGHVIGGDADPPTGGFVPLPHGSPTNNADFFYLDPAIGLALITVAVPVFPCRTTLYVAKRRLRIPLRLKCGPAAY